MSRMSKSRYVPYARGFRTPSSKTKQLAVTCHRESVSKISKAFKDGGHFETVQKCQSVDDWLAQFKEDGQTYAQFLHQCPWLSARKWRKVNMKFVPSGQTICDKYPDGKIYIVPIGNFTSDSNNNFCNLYVNDIIEYCTIFLGLPVVKLPAVNIITKKGKTLWIEEQINKKHEKEAISIVVPSRYNRKSGHYQLHVPGLLEKLRKRLPNDAICLLGLTMYDLFEEDPDLFVAGMAAGNHRVGIFSLFRYDPQLTFSKEHWHDIVQVSSSLDATCKKVILQRGCKLIVHEICHLLGIDHCIFYMCCMNGSGHLEEDFRQPMFLCPIDLRKLHTLCGFDVIHRYEQLKDFFIKHQLEEESSWLEMRLSFLR